MDVNYRSHEGVHDWPYWREDMQEAQEIGLFRQRSVARRRRWEYSTVAQRGVAWEFRFRFAAPPEELVTFERLRLTAVRGRGSGQVALRTTTAACAIRASAPVRARGSGERHARRDLHLDELRARRRRARR